MKVGNGISASSGDWSFSNDVASSFEEHISRSVPYYRQSHELVCRLSDFFAIPRSRVYDLGCSTGVLLGNLASWNSHKPEITCVGIDREEQMIQQARARYGDQHGVEFHCADILDFEYETADLVIACYTIQFLEERRRQEMIDRIYSTLNWGGAFVMFEKVGAPDARFQDMMSILYRDYKLDEGFSPEEIINKEKSLKGVLRPFSSQGNTDLLKRAGFTDIMTVMKYVCFEGFLAIK